MTTILADFRVGLMCSDSSVSNGDRVWVGRKVFRWRGALLAFAGEVNEATEFLDWWKAGRPTKHPRFRASSAMVMSSEGLWLFSGSCVPEFVHSGIEAIGSGGKAAMCAYEALGFFDPPTAVAIVCKHDAGSRKPVRSYRLHPKELHA